MHEAQRGKEFREGFCTGAFPCPGCPYEDDVVSACGGYLKSPPYGYVPCADKVPCKGLFLLFLGEREVVQLLHLVSLSSHYLDGLVEGVYRVDLHSVREGKEFFGIRLRHYEG